MLVYLILHFVFCALFFVLVQRMVFIAVNRHLDEGHLTGSEIMTITRKGVKTDLAASAYLTGIPLLVMWAHTHLPYFSLKGALIGCDVIVALILSLVTIADTMLYGPWRFRLDSSVFAYLRSPRGAFASVTPLQLLAGISGILALAAALWGLLYGIGRATGVFHDVFEAHTWQQHLLAAGCFILGAGVIFSFMRGLKHRPNSPFMVYYSPNMFYNHAGVNPLFNIIFTITSGAKADKQFIVFDKQEVADEMHRLMPTSGTPQQWLLNTQRPKNIVVILWESLCAYFVEPLGGKADVTPNLNRLCSEGILFTRVDAGSYRTDPAMICTLSGYPGHPTTSIMRSSHVLPNLPALPKSLRDCGYHTTAIHGGDLSILHMIDYLLASGHQRVVSVNDMPTDAPRGSWGVHDNYMFDYLFRDLTDQGNMLQPRFVTFLTLSSHQPFKVPYKRLDNEIDNSYAFTDEAFGKFIERLKQTPVWDDTLLVVLGDHGIGTSFLPQPRNVQPHIPILLLGGAVKSPMTVDTIMAQTDLAATLLGQLGIDHAEYTFSRDVLADTYTEPFAMHTYNNGFLIRDSRGYTDFDNVSRKCVSGDDDERVRRGRMFMQYFMTDLSNR